LLIVESRVNKAGMGFGQKMRERKSRYTKGELLAMVEPEDLLSFGMIPEFIGRLPMLATLDELDEPSLVRILSEPKNALVKQYQKLFDMEGVSLKFTDGAMASIAREALRRNTGARGLRAILEEIMLDVMYDMPSRDNIRECIISEEVVERKKDPILVYTNEAEWG
jgi:ATP-dependent Clp protease ATP-binding subunit ClpX